MKIKNGFIIRDVAGSTVVVPLDPTHTFVSMLKLNGTGKFLWERMLTETDEDALVSSLAEEYEIDIETARADTDRFLALLRSFGVLEE